MPSFEVTVRDFPDLKNRTRILLECKPPEGASCLRCGELAGISWQAACGHCFCNDCKDLMTKSHVLTCPVHFMKTPKASMRRTDRGMQETKDCIAGCAWEGCCASGSLQSILKHCEQCPKKPPLQRSWYSQCSRDEVEDNLHSGFVKIVKPMLPASPQFEMADPLEFAVGFRSSDA